MNKAKKMLLTALLVLPSCVNCFSTLSMSRRRAIGVLYDSNRLSYPVTEKEQPDITKNEDVKENRIIELPPVLKTMADERREFQLKLGKAMDTLRSDMPTILYKTPDFSIFHKDMTVVDPSGVQLTGVDAYKSAFAFFQTFCSFWFHSQHRSGIQFRMVYDFARASIRISWNVMLVPKLPLGRSLYVDGISYYQLDRESGEIMEHRVEKLIINNTPVAPPYGILSLLQQDALRLGRPQGVPVGIGAIMQHKKQNRFSHET